MAKKGGAQQLQVEISTDEELFKFLEKPGLLVMDVYSEWCGPCVAMIGSLKKIKLELGGDNLHLAICKSDTIDVLERFRNKSEPTWLFATQGKLVNLMFGADVPKLMAVIASELNLLGSTKRKFYHISEMQPEERARRDVIENAKAEARRKELEEAEREKLEYLTHVTNEIMASLPDNGVTIFGPHVVRDSYKKLMEVAESHKMVCKDRRTAAITLEQFDIVNFACENPLEQEVIENMCDKELLAAFWKVSDTESKPLEEIFLQYANDVTTSRKVTNDAGEEETIPAIIKPLQIKISTKLEGAPQKDEAPAVEETVEEPEAKQEKTSIDEAAAAAAEEEEGKEGEDEEQKHEEVASQASSDAQIIVVPPIWVPTDRRTHATLIYVFFRPQTQTFLPPDPVPDPPHIIMAFDAYKKKDIFEVINKNKENILLYGFFTNDNPKKAKLIARTLPTYESGFPQISDKLVLKVAKKTSHTMLAFVTFGPSYVSPNTVVGKEEALKFFPEGFTNEDVVEAEPETAKKKKKDKKKGGEEGETGENADN